MFFIHRFSGMVAVASSETRAGNRYFRQSEIQNFGVPSLGDKDVRGLDVAMNDAFCVGGVERVGDFDGEGSSSLRFHGTSGNAVLKRHAVEILHSDERLPVLLADLVNGADIRMVQSGGSFGFALEAAESLRVFGDIVGQELEGDEAVQSMSSAL